MAEESEYKVNEVGEEVSFVDFFAVCLRYRKLIIGLPVVAVIASAFALYVLPIICLPIVKPNYIISINSTIEEFPSDIQGYINIDSVKALNAVFSSPQLVSSIYERHFNWKIANEKTENKLAYIQNSVMDKKLRYYYNRDINIYSLTFICDDKVKGEGFVSDLWNLAASNIYERLVQKYDNAIAICKQQLDIFNVGGKLDSSSVMAKAAVISAHAKLLEYRNRKDIPFQVNPNVEAVSGIAQSKVKIVIIAFIVSLVIAFSLAFIINMVNNIRRSPIALAKIKDALESSK